MANTIASDKILMKDLFKEWFRIPDYQRPYVWGSDQVSERQSDVSLVT